MNRVANRSARSTSHRLVAATLLIAAFLVVCAATTSGGELLFFRATHDNEQYAKDPGRFDRVSYASPPAGDIGVAYVERQPTLRVALSEITSVTVEQKRYYKDKSLEDKILEALRAKEEDTSDEGVQYYYDATFTLRPNAGREIAKLLQKSNGESFDLRFGSNRLGIVLITRLPARYTGNVFTISLNETDVQRIQAIFSPIKDRITWK